MQRLIAVVMAGLVLAACGSEPARPVRGSSLPEGQLLADLDGTRLRIGYDPKLHDTERITVGLWLSPMPGAILESVRLYRSDPGLVLLRPQYAVQLNGKPAIGTDHHYPPKPRYWKLEPVRGFEVSDYSQVLVGLSTNGPGLHRAAGVSIRYRVDGQLFEAVYPMALVVGDGAEPKGPRD